MATEEHAHTGPPTGESPLQQTAQQNEERAVLALKAGHVGVFDWDIAGGKVVWTLSQEEIFGLPSGTFEYPYEAWAQSVPEEDLARLKAFFQEWMASEREEEQWEYRYLRADGTMRWIAARGILLRDAQGRAVRMIGTNQDITERKQMEEARERSLAQLQAVLDNMPEGVVVSDMEGNVLAMNAAALALHAYQSIEEARRWFPQYQETFELFDMSGQPLPLAQWPISRALRGEIFDEMEVNIRRKDLGQTRLFSFSGRPVNLPESGPMLGVLVVRDITEREQAVEALRQSEERFRAIFEQAPLGIAIIDSWSGRFLQINPKYCEIAGRSQEEMLALDWMGITHPEDVQADLDRMARLRAGELPSYHLEKRYVRKDGACVWVSLTVVPMWAGGEKLKCHIAMVEDITRRKEADAQLSAALRDLKNLKAAVDEHDIVAITDPQGTLTYVNDRFCALSKYSREELVGQNTRVLNSGYHPKDFIRNLWETIRHGRVWKGNFRNRAKDGSIFWLDTTIVPFLDDEGKPYQYMAIRSDITELKRTEEALQESEAFGISIRDSLVEHLAVLDDRGVIIAVNRSWQRFAEKNGAPELAANSLGMNYLAVCEKAAGLPRGEEAEAAREGIQSVMTGALPEFILEYPCDAPNEKRWFQMHVSPLQGSRKGVVIAHLNITQRKRADEALKEAKEAAETANRAKDQFIAVLSHELRTPLTPVLATVSALQTQAELPAELRTDMDLIHRNVEMEAALIDDLLDVTRISRGKIVLQQETVDVHGCIGTALEICRKEIQEKRLEIRSKFHAAQHQVWADPIRLRQVFWNLLKNAIKFTPEDGKITLRTQNVGDRVQIDIADTGIGIEPEVMPRIFNLFEQGEQSRTRQFGGLGLGLHIARAVVELHEGRLSAFSEGKDKGATFTVELATIAPQEKLAPPAPSVVPQERPLKILLVEDHPDTLQCLTKLLKKWGHTVATAEYVRTAQALADGQEFDLLVSDLGLPDGSGLDVMRHIKERSGIPGIALSGYGADEDIRQSRDAGFADHLVKPVNIAALRTAIQKVAFAGS